MANSQHPTHHPVTPTVDVRVGLDDDERATMIAEFWRQLDAAQDGAA
ncbi:hypothetical protein [Dietzia sp. 179-F 9C3 NHS]